MSNYTYKQRRNMAAIKFQSHTLQNYTFESSIPLYSIYTMLVYNYLIQYVK